MSEENTIDILARLSIDEASAATVQRRISSIAHSGLAKNAEFPNMFESSIKGAEELGNVSRKAQGNVSGVGKSARQAAGEIREARIEAQRLSKEAAKAEAFFTGIGKRIGSFLRFSIASFIVTHLTRPIIDATKAVIDLNDVQVKFQQITGRSEYDVKKLTDQILSLGKNLGISSSELIKSNLILAQAGFNLDKIRELTTIIGKTDLAPSFESLEKTSEGIIAVLNQFELNNNTTKAATQFLDITNKVSKEFAVESGNIIEAVRNAGGVFATAEGLIEGTGQAIDKNIGSFKEFVSLFTSIRATTRLSSNVISTGFRTVIQRAQKRSTANKLQEIFGEDFSLRDQQGQFIGVAEAFQKVGEAIKSAGFEKTSIQVQEIVEALGGIRQSKVILPLIFDDSKGQRSSIYDQVIAAADSSEGSVSQDAEKRQDSLKIKVEKLKKEFFALFVALSESDGLKVFIEQSFLLTRSLTGLIKTLEALGPLIVGFAAYKGANFLKGKLFEPEYRAAISNSAKNPRKTLNSVAEGFLSTPQVTKDRLKTEKIESIRNIREGEKAKNASILREQTLRSKHRKLENNLESQPVIYTPAGTVDNKGRVLSDNQAAKLQTHKFETRQLITENRRILDEQQIAKDGELFLGIDPIKSRDQKRALKVRQAEIDKRLAQESRFTDTEEKYERFQKPSDPITTYRYKGGALVDPSDTGTIANYETQERYKESLAKTSGLKDQYYEAKKRTDKQEVARIKDLYNQSLGETTSLRSGFADQGVTKTVTPGVSAGSRVPLTTNQIEKYKARSDNVDRYKTEIEGERSKRIDLDNFIEAEKSNNSKENIRARKRQARKESRQKLYGKVSGFFKNELLISDEEIKARVNNAGGLGSVEGNQVSKDLTNEQIAIHGRNLRKRNRKFVLGTGLFLAGQALKQGADNGAFGEIGDETSANARRAATVGGSTISGAVTGAALAGPYGAAAGAILGFTKSLLDFNRSEVLAKLNKDIEELSEFKLGTDSGDKKVLRDGLVDNVKDLRGKLSQQLRANQGSTLNTIISGLTFGGLGTQDTGERNNGGLTAALRSIFNSKTYDENRVDIEGEDRKKALEYQKQNQTQINQGNQKYLEATAEPIAESQAYAKQLGYKNYQEYLDSGSAEEGLQPNFKERSQINIDSQLSEKRRESLQLREAELRIEEGKKEKIIGTKLVSSSSNQFSAGEERVNIYGPQTEQEVNESARNRALEEEEKAAKAEYQTFLAEKDSKVEEKRQRVTDLNQEKQAKYDEDERVLSNESVRARALSREAEEKQIRAAVFYEEDKASYVEQSGLKEARIQVDRTKADLNADLFNPEKSDRVTKATDQLRQKEDEVQQYLARTDTPAATALAEADLNNQVAVNLEAEANRELKEFKTTRSDPSKYREDAVKKVQEDLDKEEEQRFHDLEVLRTKGQVLEEEKFARTFAIRKQTGVSQAYITGRGTEKARVDDEYDQTRNDLDLSLARNVGTSNIGRLDNVFVGPQLRGLSQGKYNDEYVKSQGALKPFFDSREGQELSASVDIERYGQEIAQDILSGNIQDPRKYFHDQLSSKIKDGGYAGTDVARNVQQFSNERYDTQDSDISQEQFKLDLGSNLLGQKAREEGQPYRESGEQFVKRYQEQAQAVQSLATETVASRAGLRASTFSNLDSGFNRAKRAGEFLDPNKIREEDVFAQRDKFISLTTDRPGGTTSNIQDLKDRRDDYDRALKAKTLEGVNNPDLLQDDSYKQSLVDLSDGANRYREALDLAANDTVTFDNIMQRAGKSLDEFGRAASNSLNIFELFKGGADTNQQTQADLAAGIALAGKLNDGTLTKQDYESVEGAKQLDLFRNNFQFATPEDEAKFKDQEAAFVEKNYGKDIEQNLNRAGLNARLVDKGETENSTRKTYKAEMDAYLDRVNEAQKAVLEDQINQNNAIETLSLSMTTLNNNLTKNILDLQGSLGLFNTAVGLLAGSSINLQGEIAVHLGFDDNFNQRIQDSLETALNNKLAGLISGIDNINIKLVDSGII